MRATNALPDICEAILDQISAVSETVQQLQAHVAQLQNLGAMLEQPFGVVSGSEGAEATTSESGLPRTGIVVNSTFSVNDIAVVAPEPGTYYLVTSHNNLTGVSTVSLPLTQAAAECMVKVYGQRFPECSHSMEVARDHE